MSKLNQLAYHLFNTLSTNISIYENHVLISEYVTSFNLVELSHYTADTMSNFYELIKDRKEVIIVQKYEASDFVFAAFKVDTIQMIVGPYLDNNYQIQALNQMKILLKLDAHRTESLNQFYETLNILLANDLKFIYQLLATYTPYDSALKITPLKTIKTSQQVNLPKENLNEIRLYIKNNYAFEAKLMSCVEQGDAAGLNEAFATLSTFYLPDRAPRDTLRNTKNKMIILNSISTRAAIKGGLDIYHAHEISTQIGIEIEQMKSHNEQDSMSVYILKTFADAVRDYQTASYPELVRQTFLYIYRNLKEPFSVSQIANTLFVTTEHLSRTFKQATGKTIQETILSYRILEAKKLIEQNELNLMDISDLLCFSSSAHFSTAFKKVVGMTPKAYKASFKLSDAK